MQNLEDVTSALIDGDNCKLDQWKEFTVETLGEVKTE